jgi:long-chain acyl-CoA synthetase
MGEMERINKGDTWPKVLTYNYKTYGGSRTAMRSKRYGIWQPYTWKDYYLGVKHLSLGLLSLGFEAGDKLLIIGDNAPQWYYAELAAQASHGASVGLYADMIPSEIKYIAENCEARFAIAENQEQVDKLLEIKDQLPLLKRIIYWNYKGLSHYKEPILIGYREVEERGDAYERQYPQLFEQRVEKGSADDICAIVYTSGATGAVPKGAVHTHKTIRVGAEYHLRVDQWTDTDNVVPYLPPVWMTEQWLSIGCHLLSGNTLNFAEAPETQQRDANETEPSIVFYGARQWESQAAAVRARMLDAAGMKRLIARWLMPVGYSMADLKLQKKHPGLVQKATYALANAVLFKPIRKSLGLLNARICYSTGAILSPDAFRFYHALNLPLKSLYSTTEGGALTGVTDDDIRPGTVGRAHQGAEVRVTEAGELIYRQPGLFAGYYNDPAQTAAVLNDGWFRSGDAGYVAEDGHVIFTDRMKNLAKLPEGDVLAPQLLEARLRFSPYIKDAWVFAGPQGAYAAAVVIINYDTVSRWAGQRRVHFSTFAELSQGPEVYELVKDDIERINSALPSGSRVKKYVLLHREFDADEGELTRTRKLRREVLEERYRDLIGAIYNDKAEVPIEAQVKHRDGRTGTIKTVIRIKSVEGAA